MVKDLIMMFYKSTGGYKPHRVIMYRYVFTTLGGIWEDSWRTLGGIFTTLAGLCWEDSAGFGRTLGGLWRTLMGEIWEDSGRTLGGLWEESGREMRKEGWSLRGGP